jgi:photosystem II stability/assembly factor-like uncharacterized protein
MSVENGSSGDVMEVKFKNELTGWYLTSNNQICKTTNGGINWKSIDITNIQISSSIHNLLNFGDTLIILTHTDSIMKSTNGGDNWFTTRYILPAGIIKMYKINSNLLYGVTATIGIFPDNYTKFVKSTDFGITWISIYNFLPVENNDGILSFINENTGYSLGRNSDSTFSRHTIYKTTNGGQNWIFKSLDNGQPERFLYFSEENIGYKKGVSGMYRTTDSGINWNLEDYNRPQDMFFFNANTGIMCGGLKGTFLKKTTNKGQTWLKVNYPPTDFNRQFMMLSCINNICYTAARDGGGIYKSSDAGNNWENISKYFYGTNLLSIKFINSNTGFAVGNHSGVVQTIDKGLTWFQNAGFLNLPNPYNRLLSKIQFSNENTGWISSDNGLIKTTNSGNNWFYLNPVLSPSVVLKKFDFVNNNIGWAFGVTSTGINCLYKTTNSGANFILQYQTNEQNMGKICFYDSLYGYVSFDNSFGGYNLIRTTNGGQSWNQIKTGYTSLFGDVIDFLDRDNAISMGGGGILKTTNGGDSWTQLYYTGFQGIQFINQNTGFGVTDQYYYTTNGGYNWTKQFVGMDDYSLNDIYVGSQGFAVAVGNDGKIMRTTNYGGLVGISNPSEITPKTYELYQNFPNPFNPTTKINYRLSSPANVKLSVYDALGREIVILTDSRKNSGNYSIEWNAGNLNSGIYFYKLYIDGKETYSITKKMVLLK